MPRVLGFDPGTAHLGWAVVDEWGIIGCSVQALSSSTVTYTDAGYECARLVCDLIRTFQPDVVVVEQQMRDKMVAVAEALHTAALAYQIPSSIVHAQTWMRAVGLRGLGSHAANKKRNKDACKLLYPHQAPSDHNACDAVLIATSHLYRHHLLPDPLDSE